MATRTDTRLTGLNPLSYLGTESRTPPLLITNNRAPTVNDRHNFNIGDIWIHRITATNPKEEVWILVNLDNQIATWIMLGSGLELAFQYTTDSGIVFPAAGTVNIVGTTVLTTTAAVSTTTLTFTPGLDGQLIIGSVPAWGNITSIGGSFLIVEGPNSINLEVIAIPNNLVITTDNGIATPVAGNVNVFGGANIRTEAAVSTHTTFLKDDVVIPGTLTLSFAGAGVLQTDINGLVFSDNGLDGEILIGGSTEPNWNNITSTGATVTITNGPNAIDLSVPSAPPPAPNSSFLAYQNGNWVGGATYTGTYKFLGTAVVLSEIYDVNGDFYPGSGAGAPAVFTAPVTAKYHFNYRLRYSVTTMTAVWYLVRGEIMTSNFNYKYSWAEEFAASREQSRDIKAVVDMDIGDTAQFGQRIGTTGLVGDIIGGDALNLETWVSGQIIE